MSAPEEEFYSEERWQNWLDRLADEEIDPEDEDSARLLLNLQDDVAIAVAKILTEYEEGNLEQDEAMGELEDIREVVLAEPDFTDEDKLMLLDGVQTSLVAVFYSSELFIAEGVIDDAPVDEYVQQAVAEEEQEEFDRALQLIAFAGTRIVDGDELDMTVAEDIEYGLVTEWLNGLDSLQEALADPEVIEDDE